jgi:hypothetical protein
LSYQHLQSADGAIDQKVEGSRSLGITEEEILVPKTIKVIDFSIFKWLNAMVFHNL